MNDKRVLGPDDVRRAVTRMAHEIIERNRGLAGVVLVGIQRGGVWLAESLAAEIARIESQDSPGDVPVGSLDASLYRDDIAIRPVSPAAVSDLAFQIDDATVVLVDDVLYTGRGDDLMNPNSVFSIDEVVTVSRDGVTIS
jgi:pyrimidine operon attenuation protein/uracil phosphoribosyltransferase